MFDIFKSNCLMCNAELISFEEHKTKKYCNDSCRHKHKRREKNPDVNDKPGRPKKEKAQLIWLHNNQPMLKKPDDRVYGFIYRVIELSTLRDYIGKKSFFKESNGIMKESNWLNYLTSSKELKLKIAENPSNYKTVVLQFAYSEKQLGFLELQWQNQYEVFKGDSYNKKCYKKY